MNLASLFLLAPWLFFSGPHGSPQDPRATPPPPPTISPCSIIPPRLIARGEVEYPSSLRGSNRHGRVILQAEISKKGTLGGIKVIEANFPEFVPHAIRAFRSFRYKPARLCDEPVVVYMTQTFNFPP